MSRIPKSDEPEGSAPNDASSDLWLVDTDGQAILVAHGSVNQVDAASLADAAATAEIINPAYDGHVPLVLDSHELAGLDATFDFLTSSAELFDVPALEPPAAADDASGAYSL